MRRIMSFTLIVSFLSLFFSLSLSLFFPCEMALEGERVGDFGWLS